MRKLSALIALILGLLPLTPAMADSTEAGQKLTINGNNSFQGSVTATNLNPDFKGSCSSCGGSSSDFNFNNAGFAPLPLTFNIETNQQLLAASVNPQLGVVALVQITGLSVSCIPYNPTLAATPPGNYPYAVETNGIAGGTITVTEYKPTGAAVDVGTLSLPSSAHNGPYRSIADHRLGNPYTPTSGSVLSAWVSAINATPSQFYQGCHVTALLQ